MMSLRNLLCAFGALLTASISLAQAPAGTQPTALTSLPDVTLASGSVSQAIDLHTVFGLPSVTGTVVQFTTVLGTLNVELFNQTAPITVANFLGYVNSGAYNNTFIHRSVPGFVEQGGGYTLLPTPTGDIQYATIPTGAQIQNEFHISNTRGTMAMAKLGTGPNTATDQWFFNLADNSANLDNQNGGFTVFARVIGTGMTVVDSMAAQHIFVAGSPFDAIPVVNYTSGTPVDSNILLIPTVAVIPVYPTATTKGVMTFTLSSSNPTVLTGLVTGSSLVLSAGLPGIATVSVTATDTNGAQASVTFHGTVTALTGTPTARLVNLSVLSRIQGSLAMGFVIGGAGTSGSENLLMRASGPALSGPPFNVPGVMIDPTLTVVKQSTGATVAANSGWGTPASNQNTITSTDSAVGAFALTNPASLDSAVVAQLPVSPGGYTANVAGKTGDSGYALTEVYDATAAIGTYTPTTPRLVNLSCLKQLAAGDTLTTGFVIKGNNGASTETVLIRASGPALALAPFNVSGVVPDPQLSVQPLSSASTILASNKGWLGDPKVTAVGNAVGAFSLTDPASKDSAVVVTLQTDTPYTVQVSSASGAAGYVLVEIYEFSSP